MTSIYAICIIWSRKYGLQLKQSEATHKTVKGQQKKTATEQHKDSEMATPSHLEVNIKTVRGQP